MIIAQLQVDGAKTLMSTTLPAVQGPVKYVHTYMNMYDTLFWSQTMLMSIFMIQVLSIVPVAQRNDGPNMSTSHG